MADFYWRIEFLSAPAQPCLNFFIIEYVYVRMCVCVPTGNKKFDLVCQVSTFALFLLKHSQFTTIHFSYNFM